MDDLTGKQLGPYRIVAALGEGGMAAVYKSYPPCLDRYVAVKVLPGQLALYPEFVGRFQREARLIDKLLQPHIVPVHDFGQAAGYIYLVMAFVDGCTLAQLLPGRPLLLAQVVHLTTQVADALDYAHSRGIVHRDIKPSNVLIEQRGNCLLTAFGLAQVVQDTHRFTQTGTAIGTPAYMSPEQGRGDKVDQRSDIYSLGVVLFEMTTGQVPFDAETPVGIVTQRLREPPPPARALNPALPESVERAIAKAMAKARADRFVSAGEMSLALQAASTAGWSSAAAVIPRAAVGTGQKPNVAPQRGSTPAQKLAQPLPPSANPCETLRLTSRGRKGHLALFAVVSAGVAVLGLLMVGAARTMARLAAGAAAPQAITPALSKGRPGALTSGIIAGSLVVYSDEFEGARPQGWQAGGGITATLDAGCLVLSRQSNSQGNLSLRANLEEGQAALLLFEYEPETEFQLEIATGAQDQPPGRSWAIEENSTQGFMPISALGSRRVGEPTVTANLSASAERWYFAPFTVGGEGEFVADIWERDHPRRNPEVRQALPAGWEGLKWDVRIELYTGRLIVDGDQQLGLAVPSS